MGVILDYTALYVGVCIETKEVSMFMIRKDLIPTLGSTSSPTIRRFKDSIDSLFNQFFDEFFDRDLALFNDLQPAASFPKVNIAESDSQYEIDIAVAGFNKDDVSLELKDNDLIIKAAKSEESGDSNKKYLRREISSRSFKRVVRFPVDVCADSASAEYKDGIIKFTIDKEINNSKEDIIKVDIK